MVGKIRPIRAVHDDEDIDDLDETLYSSLLAGLIADDHLSNVELDEFMEEAHKLAHELLES